MEARDGILPGTVIVQGTGVLTQADGDNTLGKAGIMDRYHPLRTVEVRIAVWVSAPGAGENASCLCQEASMLAHPSAHAGKEVQILIIKEGNVSPELHQHTTSRQVHDPGVLPSLALHPVAPAGVANPNAEAVLAGKRHAVPGVVGALIEADRHGF